MRLRFHFRGHRAGFAEDRLLDVGKVWVAARLIQRFARQDVRAIDLDRIAGSHVREVSESFPRLVENEGFRTLVNLWREVNGDH